MDLAFRRQQAADDQCLQVFKTFYLAVDPAERRKLYEYLCSLEHSTTATPVEQMSPAAVQNRIIGVQVSCQLFGNGQVASINAHSLREAIEAWDRGEIYAPHDPLAED